MPHREGDIGRDSDACEEQPRATGLSSTDLGHSASDVQLSGAKADVASRGEDHSDALEMQFVETEDAGELADGVDAIEFMIQAFGFDDLDMVRNTSEISTMPDHLDLRLIVTPNRI